MSEIKDKVFWITGASSGIGEATAYLAAQKGAKLILSARRVDELNRVRQNTGLTDDKVLVLPLNLEDFEGIQPAVNRVLDKFGRIDILFNNAGIAMRGSVLETDLEVFEKLTKVNYLAVVALTKAVLPVLKKQKQGQIVVTSSILGKIGVPLRAGYSGSKHALHGFFDALRSEVYQDNIKILLVNPGYVNTNISINALTEHGKKYDRMDRNQEEGLAPQVCATQIIKAIEKGKNEIYIGGKEILGVYIKRFFPFLINRITRNQLPK